MKAKRKVKLLLKAIDRAQARNWSPRDDDMTRNNVSTLLTETRAKVLALLGLIEARQREAESVKARPRDEREKRG